MAMVKTVSAGVEYRLTTDPDGDNGFEFRLTAESSEGLTFVTVGLKSLTRRLPPAVSLEWFHPSLDIQSHWDTGSGYGFHLMPDWLMNWKPLTAKGSSGAPVASLFNISGTNRLSFSVSEAVQPVKIRYGINEETSRIACAVVLYSEAPVPIDDETFTVRIDTRPRSVTDCLSDAQEWWAGMTRYRPCPVPEHARLPVYSTWYSFHQLLDPRRIEELCRLAKALGCESVIVDDGWQTDDNSRGYAFCGDWEPVGSKFPDMAQHVRRVHDLGMKYLLWFSVPFVGKRSKAFDRFKGKFLSMDPNGWGTLDPRFPEVREYLASIYERSVREWDIDGLKLDFIDSFNFSDESRNAFGGGRDIDQPESAVEALLTDVTDRLRRLKPEILIEFRQGYIGPLMRRFGNMFRAGDCPNDAIGNRCRTLDVRMLAGSSAVHSDMLEWNPAEPVESAALQVLNVLFSVPQISVLLDRIPADHREMLSFLLGFWRKNRDVLLDGRLDPRHPEQAYPQVHASNGGKYLVAAYADRFVDLRAAAGREVLLVNATGADHLVVETERSPGPVLTVRDCRGQVVRSGPAETDRGPGIYRISCPASGIVTIGTKGA